MRLEETKVSWQLTGVRQDPWAKAHPLVVEQEKPESEKGYYQSPDLQDRPKEKCTVYVRYPEIMEELQKTIGQKLKKSEKSQEKNQIVSNS